MDKLISQIADAITEGQAAYLGKGNVAVVEVESRKYDVHPDFLKAYYGNYENISEYARLKGNPSWGTYDAPRKPKPQAYPIQYAVRLPPGILERIDAVSPARSDFIRQAVIEKLERKEMKGEMSDERKDGS